MQLTLSLNRRTHLFIKDGKLFFKLYKQSQFTDKKDYSVVNAVPLDQAKELHKWLGDVINEQQATANCKQRQVNRRTYCSD